VLILAYSLLSILSRSSIMRKPLVSGRLLKKSFIILLSFLTLFMSSENEL